MSKAILFVNLKKENARTLTDEIILELDNRNFQADVFTYLEKPDFSDKYDIAFSLGGDGTVLYTARAMAPLDTPVIPINIGTLGFIAAVRSDKWKDVFDSWLKGKAPLSRRLMLEAKVMRGDKEVLRTSCLNDIVISASINAKMIRLKVFSVERNAIDCKNFNDSSLSLGQYRSDGLIIAKPTGSTAYSVAAGGPILDPELEAIIVNPICPFTLSYRPIVLPAREIVMVEVEKEQRSGVLLTVDGQTNEALEPGDQIFVSPLSKQLTLISSDRNAFYYALRSKFSWLETPGIESGASNA